MLLEYDTVETFILKSSAFHLKWFGSGDSLGRDAAHWWRGRRWGLPAQGCSLTGWELSGEGF